MERLPTSNTSQQLTKTLPIKICGDEGSGIKEAIQYVLALLGTPKDKQPSPLEMTLIVNYLKTYKANMPVDEIRTAYDLAIQKLFPCDLETFGGTLSLKNIIGVLKAYNDFKTLSEKKLKIEERKKESNGEPMIGMQRGLAILEIIKERKPELYEKLSNAGKEEKKKLDLPPLPYHDIHQKWMSLFDRLRRHFETPGTNGRFINRYGKTLNIESFFAHKAEQLAKVKEYLKKRNEDAL